ncbi:hypothetical protein MTBBW1_3380002 [Desulfamplus magnetovallimortis]|uniref:Uncharacterized protein n=1 Tax=Desulfamplus magnetovallimortis TaxID=1246637 RepID=A0A1W1HGD4_9BACT|nr:hypothetical protein MTBBW1_3380002 [Desulfamplus magnetovallimortis]
MSQSPLIGAVFLTISNAENTITALEAEVSIPSNRGSVSDLTASFNSKGAGAEYVSIPSNRGSVSD